jgi:hypothetical protein
MSFANMAVVYVPDSCEDGRACRLRMAWHYPQCSVFETRLCGVDCDPNHSTKEIWCLGFIPSHELLVRWQAQNCEIIIIDHHVGNEQAAADARGLLGDDAVVILVPKHGGSTVILLCVYLQEKPTEYEMVVSAGDTFDFSLYTKEDTRVLKYILKTLGRDLWTTHADEDSVAEEMSTFDDPSSFKLYLRQFTQFYNKFVEQSLSGLDIYPVNWTVLDKTHRVIVCQFHDSCLIEELVDKIIKEHRGDLILIHTGDASDPDNMIKWILRRFHPLAGDCHLIAATMGGNGHAEVAEFTSHKRNLFLETVFE